MANSSTERSYRVVRGTEIRALPIGPQEAFVLSCIDGINSEEDLVCATGFSSDAMKEILRRLAELGAIECVPALPHNPIGRTSALSQSVSGAHRIETSREAQSMPYSPPIEGKGHAPVLPASNQSGQFALRSTSSMPPISESPSSDLASRRKALARKLSQSSMRPPPGLARSLTSESSLSAEQVRQQQVTHYVALADEAAAQGDLLSAVNSLKVADSIAPGDPSVAAKLSSLQARATSEVWRDFADKAEFELYGRRYAEAAQYFEQAALGHPCWRFFERAAYCTLHSGGDLKKASELAKRAVALGPEVAKSHFTLGQVYVAAKLKESALAEFERALALDPKQEAIRDAIRSVRKASF